MPRSSKRSVKEENKMKQLKFEFMKEKDIEQRVEEIPKPIPKSSGSTGTVSSYGLSSPRHEGYWHSDGMTAGRRWMYRESRDEMLGKRGC